VERALEIIRENTSKSENLEEKQATVFVLDVEGYSQL
jgi:hypothetical protein